VKAMARSFHARFPASTRAYIGNIMTPGKPVLSTSKLLKCAFDASTTVTLPDAAETILVYR
jgi:hypothetical protein